MSDKNNHAPPKSAIRLLTTLLKEDLLEEVLGDLGEQFQRKSKISVKRATYLYWFQSMNYLRPFALRRITQVSNPFHMFKHNLKLGIRTMGKTRTFSAINIGGLALGMLVTMLVILWVQGELKYDKFHHNYDEIYQVIANRDFNGDIFTDRNMVFPLATKISEEMPQVKHAVWQTGESSNLISRGDISVSKRQIMVGGPYFEMFSWNCIKGDQSTALSDPSGIILTRSLQEILFTAEENPIGQTVTINNDRDLQVTAVVDDPPTSSSLSFDFIRPFDLTSENTISLLSHWNNYSWRVFIQTTSPTAEVNQGISDIMQENTGDENSSYFTFPMKKWHLHNEFKHGINAGGTIRYVRLFSIIGLITLLIACINFMNLATASAQKRAKEVAMRKTLGSNRSSLIFQFYIETGLVAFAALLLAVSSAYLVLPSINRYLDIDLSLPIASPTAWLFALALTLIATVVAGSYPAIFLSSFSARKLMQSLGTGSQSSIPRKVLVTLQFIASIALISATILVYQQVEFVKDRTLGYDPNNLIVIPATGTTSENYLPVKSQLLQTGMVKSVTRLSNPITQLWWRFPAPDWPGRLDEENILFAGLSADQDFTTTVGAKLIEGRDFDGRPVDSLSVLLNKSAVAAMGLEDPVGKQLIQRENELTIIGITEDLVMSSPFTKVEPMMTFYDQDHVKFLHVRLNDKVPPVEALSEMEKIFSHFNPSYPFDYEFVDENFQDKFAREEFIGTILNALAGIAIFLCSLGLVGMAIFQAESKQKEFAVRKVLGASFPHMLGLLSREYLALVAIGCLVAIPMTYFFIRNWLTTFEYHMEINGLVFVLVGMILTAITYLVVTGATWRSLTNNPIEALRKE